MSSTQKQTLAKVRIKPQDEGKRITHRLWRVDRKHDLQVSTDFSNTEHKQELISISWSTEIPMPKIKNCCISLKLALKNNVQKLKDCRRWISAMEVYLDSRGESEHRARMYLIHGETYPPYVPIDPMRSDFPVNDNWKFRSFLPVFVKLHLDSIMIVSSRLLGPPIILGPSSELLERPPSLRRPFESPRIMDSKDMPLRRPRENHRCPWAPWVFVCAEHRRWPAEDQRETPGRTWSSFHQEPRHSCQKCSKEWGRRWCKGRSRWSTRKVRSASLPFLLLDWNLELEREFWFK